MASYDQLSAMQTAVLQVPPEYNVALLGGRGGGKSVAALMLALQHMRDHGADASVLVVRRTLRALSEFEDEMLAIVAAATGGGYSYNRVEKILRVAGATITLAAIEDRRSYDKLQGKSFSMLVVEEVTQFASERLLRMLRSNLRAPAGVPTRVVYVGNPGGPLHGLIHARHILDRRPYVPYEIELDDGADSESWVTVPSTLHDNPFIAHDAYIRRLREACHGNPGLLQQWLEGAWEEGAGLLFPAFSREVHLLARSERFAVDREVWRPRVAIDWGLSSPSVSLLGLRANRDMDLGRGRVPRGSLWVVQEVTDAEFGDELDLTASREWSPSRLAERVVSAAASLGVQRPSGVVDSARGLRGEDLAREMQAEGFWQLTRPRKGRRAEGWALVSSMLTAAAERDPVRPHIYFDPSCRYLLATLPRATRDEQDPDDWMDAPSCPDHAGDALRYLVSEQRVPPVGQGHVVGMF